MPTGQQILTHPWDPTHSALVVKGWGAEHTWNQPRGVKHPELRLLGWVRAAQHRAHT